MRNRSMKLNRDRTIGRVLYIVEGSKTEFVLLQKIFCDVLGFEYIEKRRNRPDFFCKRSNPNSTIAVINTENSNIQDISKDDYLDHLFETLINQYDFPVDKSAIYYLFDRDPASNHDPDMVEQYINTLQDPYDNEDDMKAGCLLLSYPSIESYTISSFQNNVYQINLRFGHHAKTYMGQHREIQMNKISEATLLHAADEFAAYLQALHLDWDIDAFAETSRTVFHHQEHNYASRGSYDLFSMLTLSLLQLGILEMEEKTPPSHL